MAPAITVGWVFDSSGLNRTTDGSGGAFASAFPLCTAACPSNRTCQGGGAGPFGSDLAPATFGRCWVPSYFVRSRLTAASTRSRTCLSVSPGFSGTSVTSWSSVMRTCQPVRSL